MVSNNSYAPPKSTLADIAPADEIEKASRGVRLGAVLLDGLIFTIALMPGYIMAARHLALSGMRPGGNPFAIWSALITSGGAWLFLGSLINVALLIYTAILVQRNGQTIAKKWLGIKVVRTDGSKASFSRIFWLRNVVNAVICIIPLIGSLYGLLDGLFIFGEAKRCCHDYIADTIVVRA